MFTDISGFTDRSNIPLDIDEMPCPQCQERGCFVALDPQPSKAFRLQTEKNPRPAANTKCSSCDAKFSEHFLIRSLFNFKNSQLPAEQRFLPFSTAQYDPPCDIDDRDSFSNDADNFPSSEDGGQESNLFGAFLCTLLMQRF